MNDDILYTLSNGHKLRRRELVDTKPEASRNMGDVPDAAVEAFNAGVECGRANNIEGALERFEAASALAPDWPYPIFQRAFTLLLKGETEAAYKAYQRVDELEPRGFLSSKVALAALEKELSGDYPQGFYLYFLSHEWQKDDDEKRNILDEVLTVAPDFAAAYQKLSGLAAGPAERLELIESGLGCEPDAETRGMLLVNKAAIVNLRGERDAAIEILGSLVTDAQSAASAAVIAKGILLDMLTSDSTGA